MSNHKLNTFLDSFLPNNLSEDFELVDLDFARGFIGASLVLATTNIVYIVYAFILSAPAIVKVIFFSNILFVFSLLVILKISPYRLGRKVNFLSMLLVWFVYIMLFYSIYFDLGLSFFSTVWFFPFLFYSSFLFKPKVYLKNFIIALLGIIFLAYVKYDNFYDVISRHSNFKISYMFYFFSSFISVFLYSFFKAHLSNNIIADYSENAAAHVRGAKYYALEKITAKVAHDVNNPLFVIQGKVQQLTSFLSEDPELREKADTLVNDIESRIYDLSNKVKLVSAFAKDGTSNQMVVADVALVFKESLEAFDHFFIENGIIVEVYVEEKLSLICYPSYVREILANLLELAIKTLNTSGVENKLIQLRGTTHKQWVYLEVKDNGDEFKDNILTKENHDRPDQALRIAQGLSELQDGALSYLRKDRTNIFRVELPSYEEDEEDDA